MKRLFPLALTLSVAPLAYAADPAPAPAPATPVAPAPAPEITVEPAVQALLDKSAKAYADSANLSTHFVTTRTFDGALAATTTGDLSVSRPSKAKLEFTTERPDAAAGAPAKSTILLVADGAKLWQQMEPTVYKVDEIPADQGVKIIVGALQGQMNLPFVSIAGGTNVLKAGQKWESATAAPDNSVKLVTHAGRGPELPLVEYTLNFDPATSLISKAEVVVTPKDNKKTVFSTVFSAAKPKAEFVPASFTFTPPAGAKEYVEPPSWDPKLVVGATPFDLKGADVDGKTHTWEEFKGKVVLLDFWATWCGPCIGELPNVLKNYETYHPQGFEIVGVSLDSDKTKLTNFIKERDLKYINLFDGKGWDNIDSNTYGVKAIPFTLLIGKDGKIAAVNPRGEKLEPALKEALAK